MKKVNIGIYLIILGNLLYLTYIYFCKNQSGNFSDFSSGVLLGLSIGVNILGIIITVTYISKNNKWFMIKNKTKIY